MATYAKGYVRAPNKDQLILLSAQRHRGMLKAMLETPPPPVWDSVAKGWVGPVKDQSQCGCHDDKTEVLTEEGWTKWTDYDWRVPLGTRDPITGQLEFQLPTAKHVYDYDGPLCYAEHRSLDFALTPNHRMYVRKWNERQRTLDKHYRFVEVSKLGWYAGLPHATTGWAGTDLDRLGIGDRVYSGDDLLALLGLVISDGWAGGVEKTKNTVSFCCFREDRIHMVRPFAAKLGMREQPSRPGVWSMTDGDLAEWIRQNAYIKGHLGAPFKRIPQIVKVASQRQIEHFLKFFGDQHTEPSGGRRFYSSSRLLIDDLQELLLRIGKRGTIEERDPREAKINGRVVAGKNPDLTLTERVSSKLSIEKKDNVREDHYKGQVFCATVPNGTLVTRRNGSILISGNSCWAFSGTGVAEIAYNVAAVGGGPNQLILSEQFSLDCGRNGGCNGDDNTTILAEAKATGIPLTSDYGPYEGGAQRCSYKAGQQLFKLDDWGFADGTGGQGVTSIAAIKAAIMRYGCVGAGIAADDAFMNSPAGQVFKGSGNTDIDHDIILVGWDDSKGAWKLRNSWGVSWCENGYIWIAYNANAVGTEAVWGVVTNSNPQPTNWNNLLKH